MPGDGVVIGRALSPAVTIIDIKDKKKERRTPNYTSPSAHVIFPLNFWETSLDSRDRSDEFQKTIS